MLKIHKTLPQARHGDLILLIDGSPDYEKIADSYFLFDFLEIDPKEFSNDDGQDERVLALEFFIQYWIDRFKSMREGEEKFFPFDLSDQYVSGLRIDKRSDGCFLQPAYTVELAGCGINVSTLDRALRRSPKGHLKNESVKFQLSKQEILSGLDLSIQKLKEML